MIECILLTKVTFQPFPRPLAPFPCYAVYYLNISHPLALIDSNISVQHYLQNVPIFTIRTNVCVNATHIPYRHDRIANRRITGDTGPKLPVRVQVPEVRNLCYGRTCKCVMRTATPHLWEITVREMAPLLVHLYSFQFTRMWIRNGEARLPLMLPTATLKIKNLLTGQIKCEGIALLAKKFVPCFPETNKNLGIWKQQTVRLIR